MKKYTVYEWWVDEEGGLGACLSTEFNKIDDMNTDKLAEFDNVKELADIIYSTYSDCFTPEIALQEAKDLFETIPVQ